MKTIVNFAALAALGLLSLHTAAHAQTTISSGTYTGTPGTPGTVGSVGTTGATATNATLKGGKGGKGGNGTDGGNGSSGSTFLSGMTLITGGTFTGGAGGNGGNGGAGGAGGYGDAYAGGNGGDGGKGGKGGDGGYALSVTGSSTFVTLNGGSFFGGAGGGAGAAGAAGAAGVGDSGNGSAGTVGTAGTAGTAGLPLFVGNGGTLYFGGTGFTLTSTTVSGKFDNGVSYSFAYATQGAYTIAPRPQIRRTRAILRAGCAAWRGSIGWRPSQTPQIDFLSRRRARVRSRPRRPTSQQQPLTGRKLTLRSNTKDIR